MTREPIYIFCNYNGTKSYLTKKETIFIDTIIENGIKYPNPIDAVEIITVKS